MACSSGYGRRLTPLSPLMALTGPANSMQVSNIKSYNRNMK